MNNALKVIALREIGILKSLTPSELEMLAEAAIFQKVLKNKVIYDIGSKMEYVYIVEKGSIKLGIISSCGKTLTKDIIYDQEIFGENIFTPGLQNKEYAESMTETKFFKIPVSIFQTLVVQNNTFATSIMNVIVTKLSNLEDRLQNFVFRKAKERIVDFICRTGVRKGVKIGINECLIDHGMSHREIAYLTDTSRQTVARIMNELKKENFIHYGSHKSSKILIRDLSFLQQYGLVS
ncbi:MAG: Crp/Fnr family transcriptional regulator [Saprospiraceae bacterium]|nr:Crp/Fnr family transcriptional regulator [Saprospiraceae bacterium]